MSQKGQAMNTRKTLLEQIYYNEFLPSESIEPSDPDYRPTCKRIDEEIKLISQRLGSEDRGHLDKLVGLLSDMSCMSDYDNFAYGFRAGVRLMHEVSCLKASPGTAPLPVPPPTLPAVRRDPRGIVPPRPAGRRASLPGGPRRYPADGRRS